MDLSAVITELLKAAIALATALVTTCMIPLIRERLGAERLEKAIRYAELAVPMVEQVYSELDGPEKLEKALAWLELKGVKIEKEDLIKIIEATVYALKQQKG
jgi:hypothetical protein